MYAVIIAILLSSSSKALRLSPGDSISHNPFKEYAKDVKSLAKFDAAMRQSRENHSDLRNTEHPDVQVGSGAWNWLPDAKWASPICCGWDHKSFHAHEAECGKSKMPQTMINEGGIYHGRPDWLAHSGGNGCTCADRSKPTPWHYVFEPPDEWDADRFCDEVGSRSVLFLGDSTMQQTVSTVMNAAFGAKRRCHLNMTFAPSDTLVGRNLGNLNRGMNWTYFVDMMEPDIVALSTGAHVQKCGKRHCRKNYDQFIDVFDKEVLEDILRYRQSHPERRILWKTQQPGGCSREIDADPDQFTDYNYGTFRLRDEHVIRKLREHGLPFIDLRMLYRRSDAHPGSASDGADCLHMCIPGPLDVVPQAVRRALRMADEAMQ